MSLHRELIITPATVCDNTGVNIMWCLWPPVYCDTTGDGKNRLRLRDGAPGPAMSLDTLLPRESGVHPTSRPAALCWVLRLKLTPGAAQIWDRVGIDIDPSQTNERPQISECGAARSWEAHQLRQRAESKECFEKADRECDGCECDRVVTGLLIRYQRERDRQFWLTLCRELETESDSPLSGQIKLMIAFLHCPPVQLISQLGLIWADLWCEEWGDHRYPPPLPPLITSGGSLPSPGLSCVPGGSPANTYLTFGQFAPVPVGSNCHKLERLTTCWSSGRSV